MKLNKNPYPLKRLPAMAFPITLLSVLILSGCKVEGKDGVSNTDSSKEINSSYHLTEENENIDVMMPNQPVSSFWFPKELMEWKAEDDSDLLYNISHIPLSNRVEKEKLETINDTQNKDTEVVALSIMNRSTSGNAPHGLNKFSSNTFSYWQYIDKMVYWGGSSGEGLIVPPSPDVTDAGHLNGVPVLGTIFFPPMEFSGKIEWLDDFLQKDADGNFPLVDKLIEVADTYQFDGWFINQETQGDEEHPLKKEHADLMIEFIKQFKEKSQDELEIMYYDAMTSDGEVEWQNALNDKNAPFLIDEDGEKVADSMFLNFWWTEEALANEELLKSSNQKAEEIGFDPYQIYAGIDVQADGYSTPINWDLFEKSQNETFTSLGLYAADWPYSSSSTVDEFQMKEDMFWVNSKGNPTSTIDSNEPTDWLGISHYVVEKTPLTSLPFTTNFNVGNGYNFFVEGEEVSNLDWNNRSVSDILPTYRWIMEHEGENKLTPSWDFSQAYYGGNSLKFRGKMEENKSTTLKLYSADLPLEENVTFTTTAKATNSVDLDLLLTFNDESTETIKADASVGEDWTELTYDLSKYSDQTINTISYQITTEKAADEFELHLGNITIADPTSISTSKVTSSTVEGSTFDEDALLTGVRLNWEVDEPAETYEIYRINEDKSKSLLGVSNTTNFYINTLPRTDETNKTEFEVVPVNELLERGSSSTASMDWPDNSLPKSNFTASKTLVAPGETIVFENLSSPNAEEFTWEFTGAENESSTEAEPNVSYSEEGTYQVSLKVKNKSGEDEKVMEDYVVVSKKAANDLALLSQGKPTDASSYVNDGEAPEFAVDGMLDTKWCAVGTPPHELTIDLETIKTISEVSIAHAEAGNESPDMNSKAYTISVSEDGKEFTEVVNITKNTKGETTDTFAPTNARYVRLTLTKPTQGSDSAARIYQIEVKGIDGTSD